MMSRQERQSKQERAAKYVNADGVIFGRMKTTALMKFVQSPKDANVGTANP